MIDHLSPSSLNMYLRCQRQWYYRRVEGLLIPPAVAMVQGSAVGAGAEYNYQYKMFAGADAEVDTVQDVTRDDLKERLEEVEEKYDEGKVVDETIDMGTIYHTDIAPAVDPTETENKITVVREEWHWPLLGYTDVETEEGVIDIKTTKKKKNAADIAEDVQAGVYQMSRLDRDLRADFTWHNITRTKEPKAHVLQGGYMTPEESKHLEGFITQVQNCIAVSLETGSFAPCDPGAWQCSQRFCGYWNLCKGEKR